MVLRGGTEVAEQRLPPAAAVAAGSVGRDRAADRRHGSRPAAGASAVVAPHLAQRPACGMDYGVEDRRQRLQQQQQLKV